MASAGPPPNAGICIEDVQGAGRKSSAVSQRTDIENGQAIAKPKQLREVQNT
jgi:hypothetical protein